MSWADWRDWTGQPLVRAPDRLGISVSAAIFDETGRLLLMHRADNDHWTIPGGNVEIGESVTQALLREVREETGLDVSVGPLVGVYSDPAVYQIASYPNGALVHYVNLCFRCTPLSGALTGSDEGQELGYFALDQLPMPLLLSNRARIQDALAQMADGRPPMPFIC
jgi:ADP-ribose pyrophosphatase YjhB (NUDIX family)